MRKKNEFPSIVKSVFGKYAHTAYDSYEKNTLTVRKSSIFREQNEFYPINFD